MKKYIPQMLAGLFLAGAGLHLLDWEVDRRIEAKFSAVSEREGLYAREKAAFLHEHGVEPFALLEQWLGERGIPVPGE